MNSIFEIGLYLIPFDNLSIAPSQGWATISPIFFFLYLVMNIKSIKKAVDKCTGVYVFFIACIFITIANNLISSYSIAQLIDGVVSLLIGMINLTAFTIYLHKKSQALAAIEKCLLRAYYISMIIGVLIYIVKLLNINGLLNIVVFFSKRSRYLDYNRFSFTFTEPSYISMHLFGVILCFYMFTKNKKMLRLLVIYGIVALLISTSLRLIIDVVFIAMLFLFSRELKGQRRFAYLSLITILTIALLFALQTNSRLTYVLTNGIYNDNSFQARTAPIYATIYGYLTNGLFHFLFGNGIGNAILPVYLGMSHISYVSSAYLQIENYTNLISSLHIKMISEVGFIIYIISCVYLIKISIHQGINQVLYLIILMYLYLQWSSIAFYSVWIFIALSRFNIKNDHVISTIHNDYDLHNMRISQSNVY